MSLDALGQGYAKSGSSSAMSDIAKGFLESGRRRTSFEQDLVGRAMDHELTSIRNRDSDERQSAENSLNRDHEARMQRENNLHSARQTAATLSAQGVLQSALQAHELRMARYGSLVDKRARRDSFEYGVATSQLDHEHRTLEAEQGHAHATERADQDHFHATARADQDTNNTIRLSQSEGFGGNFSSGSASSSRASTDALPLAEEAANARGPKRTPSTPLPAESPAAAETPVAPAAPSMPHTPQSPRPKRQGAKEDRSGGISGVELPKL